MATTKKSQSLRVQIQQLQAALDDRDRYVEDLQVVRDEMQGKVEELKDDLQEAKDDAAEQKAQQNYYHGLADGRKENSRFLEVIISAVAAKVREDNSGSSRPPRIDDRDR